MQPVLSISEIFPELLPEAPVLNERMKITAEKRKVVNLVGGIEAFYILLGGSQDSREGLRGSG